MMKRILSILVALVMLFSVAAFAEEAEYSDEEKLAILQKLINMGMSVEQLLAMGMTEEDVAALGLTLDELQANLDSANALPELPEGLTYGEPILICQFVVEYGPYIQEDDPGIFADGDTSVLYVGLQEFCSTLKQLYGMLYPGFDMHLVVDEDGAFISRENGSMVFFLREDNSITYSDYDMYNAGAIAVNGGDMLATKAYRTYEDGSVMLDENGEMMLNLFRRKDGDLAYMKKGYPISATLDNYNISCFWTDDDLYLPLPVLNSLINPIGAVNFVYNGQLLFVLVGKPDDAIPDANGMTMRDYYYAVPSTERSQALTELTYNLLCMDLDLRYGLKDSHGIEEDFDEFLEMVGLKARMLDRDGQVFVQALQELVWQYFSDFHSALDMKGCYVGRDFKTSEFKRPPSYENRVYAVKRYQNAREAAGLALPDLGIGKQIVLEPYQEVGDTAYITFDTFKIDTRADYYSDEYQQYMDRLIVADTAMLVQYANQQIRREGSPIRRVVVDLSNNGGGMLDAAVYITSWLIGNCKFSTVNPQTGARYTVVYEADIDLDGQITDADYLDPEEYELYCLISDSSFSCGNLVPVLLKESGKVTLLGETTGGGACVVEEAITADGNFFCYSGATQLCFVKNGSYYSVDRGVEPDVAITKPAHFYDRVWLNDFIANLP